MLILSPTTVIDGVPTASTAAVDTNSAQLATTSFVLNQGYLKSSTAASTYALNASPTLTGTLTTPLLVSTDTTDSSSSTTGAVKIAGGVGIAKKLYVGSTITGTAATTSIATLNVPHGSTPSAPADGDVWTTTSGFYARINGSTIRMLDGSGTSWSTLSVAVSLHSIHSTSGTATTQIAYGATSSGATKTVNIGPNGTNGSTTAVNIGSSVAGSTSTTTVNGTLTATSDIENTATGGSVILKSPNGTRYKITVADDGSLTTTAA